MALQRIHFFRAERKANLPQAGHNIHTISAYTYTEATMDVYYPFIHEPKKKETFEPLPLYVEVGPPPENEEKKKEDERPGVIIIELF